MKDLGKDGFVLDQPHEIAMFGLLAARGRLHLELKGMTSRQSTVAGLRAAGITTARTRAKALVDLNNHIEALGGPADRRTTPKKESK